MARRRAIEAPPTLRTELAAELRRSHAKLGHLRLVTNPDSPGESMVVRRPGPSQWSDLADDLDAGKPVVVSGVDVRRWAPEVDSQSRYRVDPDGTLTLVPWDRHHG